MSNFNTSGLLQALDRIKPELKPLPQHFITSQDQHTRELYATLLAAVLLSDGQVSEPQSRLFGMLLQSMQLEPVPARFFELAQHLDAGKLKQLIQALNHQDQQCALMIDALILARLDSALSQAQIDLLAELLDCFGINYLSEKLTVMARVGLGAEAPIEALKNEKIVKLSPIVMSNWLSFNMKLGVWIDSENSLMWSRISLGQKWIEDKPMGEAYSLTWNDAKRALSGFKLAGFSDWRLPTKNELEHLLLQYRKENDISEGIFFPPDLTVFDKVGSYWSSSRNTKNYNTNHAWYVCFESGICNGGEKSWNKENVRAVRDLK